MTSLIKTLKVFHKDGVIVMLPRALWRALRATSACSAHKYSQFREAMQVAKLELLVGLLRGRRGGHHDSVADSEAAGKQ